jgi:hypothetical protein
MLNGMHSPHQLLAPLDVAKLADCSVYTVQRHADVGHLPIAFQTPRGGRLFDPVEATIYALNRRFNLNLKGVDADAPDHVATAISKSSRSAVASGYALIEAFCAMTDDAGRRVVSDALTKFKAPIAIKLT